MSWSGFDRLLGQWTLEDAAWLADRLPMILGGLVMLGLVVFLLRRPGNMRRFRQYEAEQLSQRRATAARLGLEAAGADPSLPAWRRALDAAVDAKEKVGPFPRFSGPSRVRVLFVGERDRFATTVLVQRISLSDVPDDMTSMVCFASPDLDLGTFRLTPASRMPALAEAALSAVAKALKPLVSPDTAVEEEVDFDDPVFWPAYSVRVPVSNLAEGRTPGSRDIRSVFSPAVREFFVTRTGWSVEALADRLLVYRDNVEEAPDRMPAFLDEALAVAGRFREQS